MSRYACHLFKDGKMIDDNCIFGYDDPAETFFFHSGEEDEIGRPRIWIGLEYRQFRTFTAMLELFKAYGYELQVWESEWPMIRQEITQTDYEQAKELLVPWKSEKN
ncbi:MAG: hypothetical protein K0S29_1271 [Gammaproteobacteria bacterium]|jgi:hypothetical protein|nr:hypothetical protein [Gammaproteobacteria bacterium]